MSACADPRPSRGSLVDVEGLEIGQHTLQQRLTGCSVVLAKAGAVAAVDVRGAAPGTRETDLLDPSNLVPQVQAIVLSGGSAYGLDVASGVMRWLETRGIGFPTPHGVVPIVPAAVLFDLALVRPGDDPHARPDACAGMAACEQASRQAPLSGNVGAGAGATVGKLLGPAAAMKGGIGHASVRVGPWVVGAMVACNAVGDVVDPHSGRLLAGARDLALGQMTDIRRALLAGESLQRPVPGTHTTIGVVGTNARLDKAQARRLALCGHDGLARCIQPVHTPFDGDTLFAMATARVEDPPDMLLLSALAAEAVMLATRDAVCSAQGVMTVHGRISAACDGELSCG